MKALSDMTLLAIVTIGAGIGYCYLAVNHVDASPLRDVIAVGIGALGGVAVSGTKPPAA